MRSLITGGGGFVGRWLQVALAEDGHQVWAPSSAELDVRDPEHCRQWMGRAAPDWVFHLAAKTQRDQIAQAPDDCMEVAGIGTRNLLQAVREWGRRTRVVVASSCHVYGRPQSNPISEGHRLAPESTYGLSKEALEGAAQEAGDLDVVVARLFHLVGPGQPAAFAVSNWARQSRESSGPVTVGDLDLERDYLDVRDGAAALVRLVQSGVGQEVYNVCRGSGVSLRWMYDAVTDGREPRIDPARLRADDPVRMVGDARKLMGLNWAPTIPLEASLVDLTSALYD